MFKRCSIILLILVIGSMLVIRHRHVLRANSVSAPAAYDLPGTLRQLSSDDVPPEKSWAAHFSQFVNEHPQRQWLLAASQHPALSQAEAHSEAQKSGHHQLAQFISERLRLIQRDTAWLESRLLLDGVFDQLVSDRLVEKFDRPYGTIWTESVLLDVSADRLDPIVRRYQSQLHQQRIVRLHRVIAFVSLAVLTFLGYLLLNSVTKGYFTTRLRIVTAFLILVIVLLI